MKRITFIFFWVIGFAILSGKAESPHLIYPYERVIQLGDNPEWASPTFDHQDWNRAGSTDSIGVFWVRFKIKLDSIVNLYENPGLQVISLGSHEFYWDGHLIGQSGKVGTTKAQEIPGKFMSQIPLPDSLAGVGIHTVAIRVSNFHITSIYPTSWNIFHVEEYQRSLKNDLIITANIFILAGIYLMAALYYLFLFVLRHRESEVFIFSMLCFLFFGLIIMEYVKFLYAYPYHWQYPRLFIIFILTFLISFLIPYFLTVYFNLPYRKWIALGIFIVMIIATSFWGLGSDLTNENLGEAMLFSSIGILMYAKWQKKKDAFFVLIAFIIAGSIPYLYETGFRSMGYAYDISLFISFSILVLSMMYLLAKRARQQKESYEASLLLSSRLQNELLKKNIQPHFIMNTLASLMSWVEESPKESVQFIEALSGEFEIMSDIAEQRLIPLEQEIELCQKHIQIMRYRKEVDYLLEVENIPEGEMIPPAILHTIVENGITHNLPDKKNQIKMVLQFEEEAQSKTYILKTFGKNRPTDHKKKGGTGMKYIQSRLTENYGDQWRIESKEMDKGWCTKITLFK